MELKKTAAALLAVMLAVCSVPAVERGSVGTVAAAEGFNKDDLWYTVLEDGTLEVSGLNSKKDTYKEVNIPSEVNGKKVTSISGFGSCNELTAVTIPDGVTNIGKGAFEHCRKLISVTIPDSVTSIGGGAFYECESLPSVTIPDNVRSIGEWAFVLCKSLTTITVSKKNAYFSSENGVLFNKDKTELISYPIGKTDASYTIPSGVKTIGDQAFWFGKNLTGVTIPDSVTSLGEWAFGNCPNMTAVKIPDSVTSIGECAFAYCDSLTEITIPGSVTSMGTGIFSNCSGLICAKISDGVTSLPYGVFAYTKLTSVTIPDSITTIEESAFNGCSNLKDVYYSGTKEQWEKISVTTTFNAPLLKATIHYDTTDSVKVRILTPKTGAPKINDLKAQVTANGKTQALTIGADGSLDLSGITDGSYTFKFTASKCPERVYDVTASDGILTGISAKVELHLFGDINGDGVVNTQDVAKANAHVKGTSTLTGYELACINVNSDKNINVQDVALMNAHAKNTKKLW